MIIDISVQGSKTMGRKNNEDRELTKDLSVEGKIRQLIAAGWDIKSAGEEYICKL